MALKDWKRVNQGKTQIIWENRFNSNELWLDRDWKDYPKQINAKCYNIRVRKNGKYLRVKNSIKSKSQALAYAKSYMRKY